MKVKEFKGEPTVFVASEGGLITVTTSEHMKNANKPLKQILMEICEEARKHANEIFSQFSYPDGNFLSKKP